MIDITPILQAVILLIAAVITTVVIPFIKKKTTAEQQKEINGWVKIAVAAAEQIFAGDGRGKEKKAYVLSWLEERGFSLDENVVDALIEAAVYELKNGIIEVGTVEG